LVGRLKEIDLQTIRQSEEIKQDIGELQCDLIPGFSWESLTVLIVKPLEMLQDLSSLNTE